MNGEPTEMSDRPNKVAVRMVLSEAGKTRAAAVEARLRNLGVDEVAVSPRAVNLMLAPEEVERLFHVPMTGSESVEPPGHDALVELQLDEFVEYVYFPTKPIFFER